jgi:hypothetical protein
MEVLELLVRFRECARDLAVLRSAHAYCLPAHNLLCEQLAILFLPGVQRPKREADTSSIAEVQLTFNSTHALLAFMAIEFFAFSLLYHLSIHVKG